MSTPQWERWLDMETDKGDLSAEQRNLLVNLVAREPLDHSASNGLGWSQTRSLDYINRTAAQLVRAQDKRDGASEKALQTVLDLMKANQGKTIGVDVNV